MARIVSWPRQAVIFVHPSELPCPTVRGIPAFATDFLLDTTRAAYRLVANGCVRRYPRLRIILSHAGGFVPYASHRMAIAIAAEPGPKLDDVLDDFRSFYFDTALSSTPAALPSLLAFAKPDHALFGSDWPFAQAAAVGDFTDQLEAYAPLDGMARAALDRRYASLLFPPIGLMQFATHPPPLQRTQGITSQVTQPSNAATRRRCHYLLMAWFVFLK
jgi:hypothetical protein